jgi:hypothetical protein
MNPMLRYRSIVPHNDLNSMDQILIEEAVSHSSGEEILRLS